MIVVYHGDRQVADAVALELVASGHDVRVLDTFVDAARTVRELKPDAVVFHLDAHSATTARELRASLAGTPLVLGGTPFRMLSASISAPWERVYVVAGPFTPERVRHVAERALAERDVVDAAAIDRHRRRTLAVFVFLGVAVAIALVGDFLADVRSPAHRTLVERGTPRPLWGSIVFLLPWLMFGVAQVVAAARKGERVPRLVVAGLLLFSAPLALEAWWAARAPRLDPALAYAREVVLARALVEGGARTRTAEAPGISVDEVRAAADAGRALFLQRCDRQTPRDACESRARDIESDPERVIQDAALRRHR